MEILKHPGWSTNRARLYHYQRDREDVDLILERADGQIVAIEVKSRATITSRDYKWLINLRERRGSRFAAGVLLHPREQTIPLGDLASGRFPSPLCGRDPLSDSRYARGLPAKTPPSSAGACGISRLRPLP